MLGERQGLPPATGGEPCTWGWGLSVSWRFRSGSGSRLVSTRWFALVRAVVGSWLLRNVDVHMIPEAQPERTSDNTKTR